MRMSKWWWNFHFWWTIHLKVGFLVANVDISNHQNKHAPTPKGSRPYFNSSAPHIRTQPRQRLVLWNKTKPMLLTYREETKQPWRPIAGLPAPWVLSSAGKLIWYLRGSYFLPYHNTVSTPDASGAARQNTKELIIIRGGIFSYLTIRSDSDSGSHDPIPERFLIYFFPPLLIN